MNYKAYITSIFAGVLASIAWIENSSGILMILAFSLFVHLYHETVESGDHHTKVFQVMLPGFLVYNLLSFSWLHKVSVPGAIAALMINTFMMASVFWVSGLVHRRTVKLTGFMTLIAVWLVYEHLTTVVPVFSPWLNPGNAFGNSPELVQWYEYTGTGGGSLWIMLSAIMIYLTYTGYRKHKWNWGLALLSSSIIIIPVVISLTKYFNYREKGIDTEIVIVQPNIDPYKEKFGTMSFTEQLDKMLEMAAMNTTDNTDWIIFPETSIDDPFKEVEADSNKYIIKLKSFNVLSPFNNAIGFSLLR